MPPTVVVLGTKVLATPGLADAALTADASRTSCIFLEPPVLDAMPKLRAAGGA